MIKKWIGLGICLSLVSCVAAVVAGAAGMAVYDRRSIPMIEHDARNFYEINTAIAHDYKFQGSHIVITSFNEVILLAGQTNAASLKMAAEKIAERASHVRRVYDEITVGPVSTMVQRSHDTWITGEIRSRMLTKKGLESGSIRVVTENGTVFLMGIATPEQANLSVDVARGVEGVNRVVKIFQYIR